MAPMGLPVDLTDASLVNHVFIITANEGARLLIDGVGTIVMLVALLVLTCDVSMCCGGN